MSDQGEGRESSGLKARTNEQASSLGLNERERGLVVPEPSFNPEPASAPPQLRVERIGDAMLILGDCRDILPTLGRVDAVVTDPPYGIGESNTKNLSRGGWAAPTDYGDFAWDSEPIAPETMRLVRAAGEWAIIFGGNYYDLPPTSCWLVWDKLNTGDFADCELAWTNLPKAVRRIRYLWNGCMRANGELRGDHPTQKPLGVVAWALQQLPSDCRTILDPFMGSGTTGVACAQAGLAFVGIEREPKYFEAACRRIAEAYRQPRLFAEPAPKIVQGALFDSGCGGADTESDSGTARLK